MKTALRSSLPTGLFKIGLVSALLFVPLVTQEQTFFGSGGTTNTATNLNNVAFGYLALNSITGGSYNTAFGYNALTATTTGNYNVANGDFALNNNTTGNENTANGYAALYYNTTGNNNTANGLGALASNTTGNYNTATGSSALNLNTTGFNNTANGVQALGSNTTGYNNTATGYYALNLNTTGSHNSATGYEALLNDTSGSYNTANGESAMRNNLTGYSNTAQGYYALAFNTRGAYNIALGYGAGQYTNGNNNIALGNFGTAGESGVIRIGTAGTHNAAYIAGINGVTASGGVAVYINSNGQLGTLVSSRRFKHDIKDMGSVSEKLMQLRPVTFRYNDKVEKGPHSLQYGLIAEEVAKVYPNLVQYDKAGKPLTVYYHLLTPMLLNELQKEHQHYEAQKTEIASLKATLQKQSAQLAKLTTLVEASQNTAPRQRTVTMQP